MHTDAGVFQADAAIVTVPLGVLKRKDGMVFQPPLPAKKRAAIKRLGFGCLNKVMMLFPHCFWGDKVRGCLHWCHTSGLTSRTGTCSIACCKHQKHQLLCMADVVCNLSQLLIMVFHLRCISVKAVLAMLLRHRFTCLGHCS